MKLSRRAFFAPRKNAKHSWVKTPHAGFVLNFRVNLSALKVIFNQNISSLVLILWDLLKKKGKSWLSLKQFQLFFDHISVLR